MMTEDEVPLAAKGLTGDPAYDYLLGLGPQMLVVKQGGAGCLIVRGDGREQVAGFSVPVVDTVGAGDCFDAAFIYGRLQGWDWRQSAVLGNAAGGAAVQKAGAGRNVPACADVQAVLRDAGVTIELVC
jgi:sugar/nucleoside kinase (ribokinase family)